MRLAQTGVQILLGFLMTSAFSPRFASLTELQAGQYVLTLLVAFGAAVFLTAPAPFHRVVFRCDMRAQLVTVSNRLAVVWLWFGMPMWCRLRHERQRGGDPRPGRGCAVAFHRGGAVRTLPLCVG